jgi:hypothetical protein
MVVRNACSECGSIRFKKNGHMHSGKQNHWCKVCGRQFVVRVAERIIADEQCTLIEHLLREHISLRGICRAVGAGLTWLLYYMVERFVAYPDHLRALLLVRPIAEVLRQLEAETDEMWSFVAKEANRQRLWIAMDAKTRQVMAFHIGDRSRNNGEQLWAKLPNTLRQCVSRLVRETLSFSK